MLHKQLLGTQNVLNIYSSTQIIENRIIDLDAYERVVRLDVPISIGVVDGIIQISSKEHEVVSKIYGSIIDVVDVVGYVVAKKEIRDIDLATGYGEGRDANLSVPL